jgi:hypothetical protein
MNAAKCSYLINSQDRHVEMLSADKQTCPEGIANSNAMACEIQQTDRIFSKTVKLKSESRGVAKPRKQADY